MTLFILFFAFISYVEGVCYFPVQYQGEFATQTSIDQGSEHKYSKINILPDGIPVWGRCHRKMGNNVILKDEPDCIRCFHITLQAPNIIQIYTMGVATCYTTEELALRNCPTMVNITAGRTEEIMLYKTGSFNIGGLEQVDKVHCPFSGRFHFTYKVNDGIEDAMECPQRTSTISNCPLAYELNLRFKRCSFGELEMKLQCLGDWTGYNGEKYLALLNPRANEEKPRYRCAMYRHDTNNDITYLSFSSDATCHNDLHSPWNGYDTMVLSPLPPAPKPATVAAHQCVFPKWAQGRWQNLRINGREINFSDNENAKTYTASCLSQHAPHGERYALYSRSQCGEQEFTCIWIKKRDANVIEFQISAYPSRWYNVSQICSNEVFKGQTWVTQGSMSKANLAGCPVKGKYTGVVPDDPDLCAEMSSNCDDPQNMHYTVSLCKNNSQIYEDREYVCLGQWEENGIMYTYTHRSDVGTYECFAGVVVSPTEVFIIEAGVSCLRGVQPLVYGMKVEKQASCEMGKTQQEFNIPAEIPEWRPKPLRPTSQPDPSENEISSRSPHFSLSTVLLLLSSIVIFYHKFC